MDLRAGSLPLAAAILVGSLAPAAAAEEEPVNEFGATGFAAKTGVAGLLLEADFRGRDGVRYHGRGGPASPLNGDEITPFFGGPVRCFSDSPDGNGSAAVGFGDRCRLGLQYTNDGDEALIDVTLSLPGADDLTVDRLEAGDAVVHRSEVVFDTSTGAGELDLSVSFSTDVDRGETTLTDVWSYVVEVREPTAPLTVRFDPSDRLEPTVTWEPPLSDGGADLVRYEVRLVQEHPAWWETGFDPEQRFLVDQPVCSVDAGAERRCALTADDPPLVGEGFRFGVRAFSETLTGYEGFTDPFELSAADPAPVEAEPTPEPAPVGPEPAPDEPEPTPIPDPESRPGPQPEPEESEVEPGPIPTSYTEAVSIEGIVSAQDYSAKLDAPVLRFYRAYFNREPDLTGARYWLGIRRSGVGLDEIAAHMAASTEHRQRYVNTTEAEYLDAVYLNVLGRPGDEAGHSYWLGLLSTGQLDRAGVVRWISAAPEFIRAYPFEGVTS